MERRAFRVPGFLILLLLVVLVGAAVAVVAGEPEDTAGPLVALAITIAVLAMTGFTVVNPNESRVVQFFGRYIGTIQTAGFHWTVPFSSKRRVSLRVRNFETARLKVSDADGNPVEIAAVVVWRVVDTFKASC